MQTFQWIQTVSFAIAAIGVILTWLTFKRSNRIKRSEWLLTLFEKFYEQSEFKDIRRWMESGEIEMKVTLDTTVTEDEEKFTDYLNFFEFIATLESNGQLKQKDVSDLFDYFLKKLKGSPKAMMWINREDYGFENLRTLLNKF